MTILLQTLFLAMVFFPVSVMANPYDKPEHAAIVSAHLLATQAGEEILDMGGNAFDAAIAVSAALAVVEPYGSGLGGGGFWLFFHAERGQYLMIDARETAPKAAYRDMFLDRKGHPDIQKSQSSVLAAGIPGIPTAYVFVAEKYGRLPLAKSLAPAIRLARKGFAVGPRYVKGTKAKQDLLAQDDIAAGVFLDQGRVPEPGWVLKQPDLARTLQAIADKGFDGFYKGKVAEKLVSGVRKLGGIWQLSDLAEYKVKIRNPVIGKYHGTKIVSAAPPSSGGVALVETLNILSGFDLGSFTKARRAHVIVEAMRRAYADRSVYLGDPDYAEIPVDRLLSSRHADEWRSQINLGVSTDSRDLEDVYSVPNGEGIAPKGMQTTHFSILDKDGNRVAGTQSINFWFGCGKMPAGTGVVLNNEMDDFTSFPGVPNGYGLVQGQANTIEPGKRMLSSMSPTFLESKRGVAILGTPGGSRIISMVVLATLAWHEGASAEQMVTLPRFHHQYLPDYILFEEDAFDSKTQNELKKLGHLLKMSDSPFGNMNVVTWDYESGRVDAASDPRGKGTGRVY